MEHGPLSDLEHGALSRSKDGTLTLWDTAGRSQFLLPSFKGDSDSVTAVALSADGRRALSGSEDGQNLTEALIAVQLVQPGVYVAMHNKLLQFPGVIKDPQQGTFIKVGGH